MTKKLHARRPRATRVASFVMLSVTLAAVFSLFVGVAPASAHAQLLDTTPGDGTVLAQAPVDAEFLFNEAVTPVHSGFRLYTGGAAEAVVLEARAEHHTVFVHLPDNLTSGAYALSYRVVSADGHTISGAISFWVGERGDAQIPPSLLDPVAPAGTAALVFWLTVSQYLGLLILGGLLFFNHFVLRQHHRSSGYPRLVLSSALSLAAVSTVLLIPALALQIAALPPSAVFSPPLWLSSVLLAPVVSATVVVVTGMLAYHLSLRKLGTLGSRVVVVLACVAVATPVLLGHSRSTPPVFLMVALDVTHLVAGAFWVGSVVGLLMMRVVGQEKDQDEALLRFSRFALFAVLLLVSSGAGMSALILDDWDQLLTSNYGRTLLLKVSVSVVVVILAAWNRTRLLPRPESRALAQVRRENLLRILRFEVALLVTVIVLTGFLTDNAPSESHQHHSGPNGSGNTDGAAISAESQGLKVDGLVRTTEAGTLELSFLLTYDEVPVTPDWVQVESRLPTHDLGPFTHEPRLNVDEGTYTLELQAPLPGVWDVQIAARVDMFTVPVVVIPIIVN